MLRKILLSMSLIFIFSIGVACAAERTYEVTEDRKSTRLNSSHRT